MAALDGIRAGVRGTVPGRWCPRWARGKAHITSSSVISLGLVAMFLLALLLLDYQRRQLCRMKIYYRCVSYLDFRGLFPTNFVDF